MQELHRISVFFKEASLDSPGRSVIKNAHGALGIEGIESVLTGRSYLVGGDFSAEDLSRLAGGLFTDPIVEFSAVDSWPDLDFDFAVETGYKPGVTDNEAHTAREGISDLLGRKLREDEEVYTRRLYFFKSSQPKKIIEQVAGELLYNALIQDASIVERKSWVAGKKFSNTVNIPHFSIEHAYETIPLELSDAELVKLSDTRVLSLSREEMIVVRDYFRDKEVREDRMKAGLGNDPTDVELEMIAQTWSEHCKHKIFAAQVEYRENGRFYEDIKSLYKTYIKNTTEALRPRRSDLLSVFEDNAGVVQFDEKNAYCIKVETHNSPSALDPYGGAMTGIVGVNRDILGTGMGAKPIFNTDVFCFADPFFDQPLPPKLMHPKRIFSGVHKGIIDGGNESGIPTVNGAIVFDNRFLGKPLVFCGTGGFLPLKTADVVGYEKTIAVGDKIVMLGGRIGKDGIHGATFSSAALTESSPTSAVQIGDPITQKKMIDFLLEARDKGLDNGLTDNGAGGLSSSIGEMARTPGGAVLELEKAPLKYPGLHPWEILVSEAQERMSLSVGNDTIEAFLELARLREVEASVIGEFNDSGFFEARFEGKIVCRLDMDFLHDGLPEMKLVADWKPNLFPEPVLKTLPREKLEKIILRMMGRPNIASKEAWVRQYDHEVQAQSIVKPFTGKKQDGPSDAGVIRPDYRSDRGLAISCALLPRLSDIDTFHMAQNCVDEAIRNLVCVGGDPAQATGLDNFCWPDPVKSERTPDGEYKLAQLVRCCMGLEEICLQYNVPFVSGKDSMKNDYGSGKDKISVPPTLLFTAMAIVEDVHQTLTSDFKKAGSRVYLLGVTRRELGGSEFYSMLGYIGHSVPHVDWITNRTLYERLHSAIRKDLLLSCHDLSDGGLACCLSECAIGGRLGFEIDLTKAPRDIEEGEVPDIEMLFAESAGRFIVEVAEDKAEAFEKAMEDSIFARIGKVTEKPYAIIKGASGEILAELPVNDLAASWQSFGF